VLGLEGDFDYFHSTPGFSNNTNTLGDGVTPFTISQSLTTNYLATVRPRIGIGADRNSGNRQKEDAPGSYLSGATSHDTARTCKTSPP
jgi:hypothetical protein